jgi:hypothetical protein
MRFRIAKTPCTGVPQLTEQITEAMPVLVPVHKIQDVKPTIQLHKALLMPDWIVALKNLVSSEAIHIEGRTCRVDLKTPEIRVVVQLFTEDDFSITVFDDVNCKNRYSAFYTFTQKEMLGLVFNIVENKNWFKNLTTNEKV